MHERLPQPKSIGRHMPGSGHTIEVPNRTGREKIKDGKRILNLRVSVRIPFPQPSLRRRRAFIKIADNLGSPLLGSS